MITCIVCGRGRDRAHLSTFVITLRCHKCTQASTILRRRTDSPVADPTRAIFYVQSMRRCSNRARRYAASPVQGKRSVKSISPHNTLNSAKTTSEQCNRMFTSYHTTPHLRKLKRWRIVLRIDAVVINTGRLVRVRRSLVSILPALFVVCVGGNAVEFHLHERISTAAFCCRQR